MPCVFISFCSFFSLISRFFLLVSSCINACEKEPIANANTPDL